MERGCCFCHRNVIHTRYYISCSKTQVLVWVAMFIIGHLMFPQKPVNTSLPVSADVPTSYIVIFLNFYLQYSNNLWWQNHWLCSWSFPFKVQSSIILFHTHRGVTSSLKLNLFDPDGHRRILIYRKQHTVPFITVAHLRVIFTFSLIIKCVVFCFQSFHICTFPKSNIQFCLRSSKWHQLLSDFSNRECSSVFIPTSFL